jgi:hypothetical protein
MVIVNAKRFPRGTFGAARLLQRCGPGLMRNAQRALALFRVSTPTGLGWSLLIGWDPKFQYAR